MKQLPSDQISCVVDLVAAAQPAVQQYTTVHAPNSPAKRITRCERVTTIERRMRMGYQQQQQQPGVQFIEKRGSNTSSDCESEIWPTLYDELEGSSAHVIRSTSGRRAERSSAGGRSVRPRPTTSPHAADSASVALRARNMLKLQRRNSEPGR